MKKIVLFFILTLFFVVPVFAAAFDPRLNNTLGAMLQGDFSGARDSCRVLEVSADPRLLPQIRLLKGLCLVEMRDYPAARTALRNALAGAGLVLTTDIYMAIADSYFQENLYEQSANIYEQLLTKAPGEDHLAALYYRLGKSLQKQGKWVKADYYFDLLRQKYPESFEKQLVERTSTGGNFFTVQVGCFTRQANAAKLSNDLRGRGYESYITEFDSGGRKLYRVRVGKFISLVSAQYTEKALRTKENLPTYIFP